MSTIKRNINTSLSSGLTPARRKSLTRAGFNITPANAGFNASLVLTPTRPDFASEQPVPNIPLKEDAFSALLVSALYLAYSRADDPWPLPAAENTRIDKYTSKFGSAIWDAWVQSLVQALNAHMATSQARDNFRRLLSGDQRFTGGLCYAPKSLQETLLQEWQRHSERVYYDFLRATAPTALAEPLFPSTPIAPPLAATLDLSAASPEIPLQTYARTPRNSVSRARFAPENPLPMLPNTPFASSSSSASSSAATTTEDVQAQSESQALVDSSPAATSASTAAETATSRSEPPAPLQYHMSALPHKHKVTIFGHAPSQRTAAVALAAAGAPLAKVEHKANWSILTFIEPTHAAALLARSEHLQLGDSVLGAVPYNAAHEDDVPVRSTVVAPAPACVSAQSLNGTQRQVYAVRVVEKRGWLESILSRFF